MGRHRNGHFHSRRKGLICLAGTLQEKWKWSLILFNGQRILVPPCGGSNPPAPANHFNGLARDSLLHQWCNRCNTLPSILNALQPIPANPCNTKCNIEQPAAIDARMSSLRRLHVLLSGHLRSDGWSQRSSR